MPPTADELLAAAAVGAAAWGFDVAAIDVLSMSENVVFDVTLAGGEHVALRLHRPGYNTVDEMQSEVRWVQALAATGVPVPQPMPALNGEYYLPVDVGGEMRQVGVIEWVAGEPVGSALDGAGEDVPHHYANIGRIAARLRVHNEEWTQPDGFVRRRWDAEGLVGLAPLWGRFWDLEGLTPSQQSLFAAARERLFATLSGLSRGPERFGLIHADLHLGNLMADGDALTVIDFDDAGFGWYSHELAVSLHSVWGEPGYDQARAAMIDGYQQIHPLAADEIDLIDDFLVVRSLMIVAWLSNRPEVPAYVHFAEIATEAEEVAVEYLDKEVS